MLMPAEPRPEDFLPDDEPLYEPGQLVLHKRYHYRGVVVEADAVCQAGEDWYHKNQTKPNRNQPWYHVLVHETSSTTYAAEENLLPDESDEPIRHPLLEYFFSGFEDGRYIRNQVPWPGTFS